MLLIHGYVPAFDSSVVEELHLQAEHLGYRTDDALVVCSDSRGHRRRQLWSMKHRCDFTERDEVFRDVIADAWADYSDVTRFNRDLDIFILATGPLTPTNKHLITLLEFARATASAEDFLARVAQKGLIAQKSREYLDLIHQFCNNAAGRELTSGELWSFTRCFHVCGYDFDQEASQDEARLKTLLAMAVRRDSGQTGNDLWNAIFKWVADRNPRAGSFTRQELPAEWRQISTSIAPHYETGAIHRLLEHSNDLLKRIRTSLGPNHHLPRQELVEQLAEVFVSEQFTVVTGQAGSGKSAVALTALRQVQERAPLFVFQATEFARDNLDHALADLRVTEPLSEISALFALHRRKFVLIESVERLLESVEREAFYMLLNRLMEDPTWRVVLTCREHAVSMMEDAFLRPLGVSYIEIATPLLNSAELEEVVQAVPGLQSIVSNARTRVLLRNPYFLDKVCSIDWVSESPGELFDEHRLRDVLWRQVVAREQIRTNGIHRQRERVFCDIALRRARSLQSFVPVSEGKEFVVQTLVADELLVEEPGTARVAPAHDVLEDWALVRWISENLVTYHNQGAKAFFDVLGCELPIRRSYRQWLQEALVAEESRFTQGFVDAVLTTPDVALYWKDETLVSVLLSDEAPRFFENYEPMLLADGKYQLKRVIHLLRVACKSPDPSWRLPEGVLGRVFGDMHLIPHGRAWGSVIRLVYRSLQSFDEEDLPLVLGLLEDWKAGINQQNPLTDAAREAGLIALYWWQTLDDDWQLKETFARLSSLLLAAPQAIAPEFKELLETEPQSSGRSYRMECLEKKLLASFECWAACRSHPLAVAKFAERMWGITHPAEMDRFRDEDFGLENMERHFGLQPHHHAEYFPASAFQGPFLPLFRANPAVGIDLILKLINITTERFVKRGIDNQHGERPSQVEADLGDSIKIRQWVNPRLWLMHREGMPAPDLIVSALMALEKWLLELAEAGQDLRDVTRRLILQSQSSAITSTIASVAMAHPFRMGDTALALLRTPEFFELDRTRHVRDLAPLSSIFGDWAFQASKRIYHKERADSDKLPYRQRNLEWLALTLQTSPLCEDVWKIIDEFKSQLPPTKKQTEQHKLWRLRLHRIDLRNYSPNQTLGDGRVLFAPGLPAPDVVEMIKKNAPTIEANEEAASVVVWAQAVFARRDADKYTPDRWREMLVKARDLAKAGDQQGLSQYEGGPGYVAAICVRDHCEDLDPDAKIWCREFLLSKVTAEKDVIGRTERVQGFSMASSRAAAQVLPLLLDGTDDRNRQRVREAIAAALTHGIREVREYAAMGVGRYLWERDAEFASSCIGGLLDLVELERRCYEAWKRQPFSSTHQLNDLVGKDIGSVRTRIASSIPWKKRSDNRIDLTEPFSARILPLIAAIISREEARPLAQDIMRQIAESFVRSWKKRQSRHDDRRNYEAESILKTQFAQFLVRCEPSVAIQLWTPLAEAISQSPDEVAEVFSRVISAEDAANRSDAFWSVWQETARHLSTAPRCSDHLADEDGDLAKLGSALLLDGIPWKDDARDWKPLHGHENDLRLFVKAFGSAPPLCKSFVRLLSSIGSVLLPDALVWLDECLRRGDPSAMIEDRNSLFNLARILTPLVFSQTGVLRKSPNLRTATLHILESMVELGSSAAFRMRDFLITPVAPIG